MALTLFSRQRPDLPDIRRFEPPLAGINQAIEHACRQLDRGNGGPIDGRTIRLDQRNREIVKSVEEILNLVIPSLQGAAAVLEDAVLHPSTPTEETGVEGQVRALKKSIATAVLELHKGLEFKKSDTPKSMDLPREEPPEPLDEAACSGRPSVSATRAIASAKRHLQSLHLPGGEDAPGDAAPAMESRIAKTMNEVAFQTNLLTLNAAVESYHTGAPPDRDRKAPPPPPPADGKDPDESREFDEVFIMMDPRDQEMLAEFYP